MKFCPDIELCLEDLKEESSCPALELFSARLKEELRLESQDRDVVDDVVEAVVEMLLTQPETPNRPPLKLRLARMLSHQWIFLMALVLQEMATPA